MSFCFLAQSVRQAQGFVRLTALCQPLITIYYLNKELHQTPAQHSTCKICNKKHTKYNQAVQEEILAVDKNK